MEGSHSARARAALALAMVFVAGVVIGAGVPISPADAIASAAPARVPLAAGNGHSCAVSSAGTVKCWGLNGDGELGDGSTDNSARPVPVTGLEGVRAVAAGAYHSCALSAGGTVKCWGYNFHGELGDATRGGPETCARRPGAASQVCSTTPVAVLGLTGVSAIAAGAYHSCALLFAGTVKCWGYNADGQLGDGTVKTSAIPVSVRGLNGVRAIAAGGVTSCALLRAGTVKCWGNHFKPTPTTVIGFGNVIAIAAGYYHVCALSTAGTVRCVGNNSFGQLGDGTFASSLKPMNVAGLDGVTAIAAGEDDSCALLETGAVMCWGYDQWGQLGTRPNVTPQTSCDGGAPCHPFPIAVSGLTNVASIAAGYKHSCASLTTGGVKCWGYDGDGELGNNDRGSSYVPVQVSGL